MKKFSYIFYILLFTSTICFSQQDSLNNKLPSKTKTLVYKFDIKEEIAPAIWRQTYQSIDEAVHLKADLILIHMNTYGGMVDAADSIRTKILNCEIPIYVFIDNNAASAGALISIACDRIYMRPGGNIGAATVVDQTGEQVPDKYQSYMRSMMRSTAEAHGKIQVIENGDTTYKWFRNPAIAEAMVDASIVVENVSDSGKVLTFTADEAMLNGFCEGKADNVNEVLKLAGVNNYEIIEYKLTTFEKIMGFLVNPYFHSILIMIMLGGIYFELQTPGIGFPLAAAFVAAILYFAPLYLEGLAENWEIILFIVGLILIGIEIFVIPGFGVTGIAGIVLIISGLALSMIDALDFSEGYSIGLSPLFRSVLFVVAVMLFTVIGALLLSQKALNSKAFSFAVLSLQENKKDGFVGVEMAPTKLNGKIGIASTDLRPSGKVEIESEIYDAKAEFGYIPNGSSIKVIRYETGQVYVVKI